MPRVGKPTPSINRARLADVQALTAFEREAFTGYYAPHRFTANQFRYYLRRPQSAVFVARIGDRILGYVLAVQYARGDVGRVLSLAVAKRARGQGIGRSLLRLCLRGLYARGCRRVYLEVATKNRRAIGLFRSVGFQPVRRLLRYYTATTSGIRMKLALDRRS